MRTQWIKTLVKNQDVEMASFKTERVINEEASQELEIHLVTGLEAQRLLFFRMVTLH